jgi:hypothetical protein
LVSSSLNKIFPEQIFLETSQKGCEDISNFLLYLPAFYSCRRVFKFDSVSYFVKLQLFWGLVYPSLFHLSSGSFSRRNNFRQGTIVTNVSKTNSVMCFDSISNVSCHVNSISPNIDNLHFVKLKNFVDFDFKVKLSSGINMVELKIIILRCQKNNKMKTNISNSRDFLICGKLHNQLHRTDCDSSNEILKKHSIRICFLESASYDMFLFIRPQNEDTTHGWFMNQSPTVINVHE